MRNCSGPPVRGNDFFDRQREQRQIWQALETDNLLLLAPRRVGKTSLLIRLAEVAPDQNFQAVVISVADVPDESAFISKLYGEVRKLCGRKNLLSTLAESAMGAFLKKVKKAGGLGFTLELDQKDTSHWAKIGKALTSFLNDLQGNWLLEIDEIPVFVLKILKQEDGKARVARFLYWLRELRQEQTRVRWVFAGSIGLDAITARYHLGGTINDLRLVSLGAFDAKTAHTFLEKLGESYQVSLSRPVRTYLLNKIGWTIPYYIQVFFAELRDDQLDHRDQPKKAAVDRVFEKLLSPSKKAYFDYWRQRLYEELGSPESHRAVKLLNVIAKDETGVSWDLLYQALSSEVSDPNSREAALRYLLNVLEGDGYLVQEENRFRFRMNLLRE